MDKRLVCKIKVPRLDRKEPGVSTGYAVCRDRIILSRHAVFNKNRNMQEPIEVEWPLIDVASLGNILTQQLNVDDGVKFKGERDVDLLVLVCKTPDETPRLPWMLTESLHKGGEAWNSYGFARARRLNNENNALDVQGKILPPNPHKAEVALDVNTEIKPVENWKGISGAPIFIGKFMAGIIIEKEVGQDRRLYALSTTYLLRTNESFRESLGFVDRTFDLQGSTQLLEANESELFNCLNEKTKCINVEEFLDHCTNLSGEELLGLAHKAQEQAVSRGDIDVCTRLGSFLLSMLPNIADQAAVENLQKSAQSTDEYVVELPCATKITAEMVAAKAGKRCIDFRSFSQKNIIPKYALPLPAEMGSEEAKNLFEGITEQFYNGMGGKPAANTMQAVTRFLYDEEIPDFMLGEPDEALKVEVVQDYLEDRELDGKPNYYWLLELPAKDDEQSIMLSLASLLKQKYPQVLFIVLSTERWLRRKETREYRQLIKTLSYLYAK